MPRTTRLLYLASSLLLAFAACKRTTSTDTPVGSLVEAVDSAAITVWNPEQSRGDTLHHSTFYDSVLHYVGLAVPIEGEKRTYAQSLIDLAPLLPQNLETAEKRKRSEDSLSHYGDHLALWAARLDSLQDNYRVFVRRALDTLYHRDSSKYLSAMPELVRRDLFQPAWRAEYDSIEQALTAQTLSVLRFVDTNERSIEFDTTMRFESEDLAVQYAALTSKLIALSQDEARIARRSQWGHEHSEATASPAATADSTPVLKKPETDSIRPF